MHWGPWYERQEERESQLRTEVKGMINEDEDGEFCVVLNRAFKDLMTQKIILPDSAAYVALPDFDLT